MNTTTTLIGVGALTLAVAAGASADVNSNFEAPSFSTGALTGQNGWYSPGTVPFTVHPYGSDPYGFAANPAGGQQFIVGNGDGNFGADARIDPDFSLQPMYDIAYDINIINTGVGTSNNETGLMATSGPDSPRLLLNRHNNNPTETAWAINLGVSGGTLEVASELSYNHWYRVAWRVDYGAAEVLSFSLIDLSNGMVSTTDLTGTSLLRPTGPLPTYFSITDGSHQRHITALDNVTITAIPAPGAAAAIGLVGLAASRRRR